MEHVRFVFGVDDYRLDACILTLVHLPSVEYTALEKGWVFSMNARNLREFVIKTRSAMARAMLELACEVMPAVYGDLISGEEVTIPGA